MSSESKPSKPFPSAAEINAYVERSAARTKMRLPLAKGNALPTGVSPPAPVSATPAAARALPVRSKTLPTQTAPAQEAPRDAGDGWTPFDDDKK